MESCSVLNVEDALLPFSRVTMESCFKRAQRVAERQYQEQYQYQEQHQEQHQRRHQEQHQRRHQNFFKGNTKTFQKSHSHHSKSHHAQHLSIESTRRFEAIEIAADEEYQPKRHKAMDIEQDQ